MKISFRRLKIISLCVLLTILLVLGGAAWVMFGSLPSYSGKAEIKSLTGHVKVYRDVYGVPHIFADTRADALRALGYLHASERFFQMEMQRRAGQGRLAEAVGPDMLGVDKFIRTLGLYHLAETGYAAMAPDSRRLFQAYADGVNSWMDTHTNSLPPEFFILGIHPDPWKPADSVVWGKLMALQLSHNYKLEILRAQLAGKLSSDQMKILFPGWANAPVTMEPRAARKADLDPSADDIQKKLSSITGLDHAASNEWVISGSRTQSGKPILANDPHLSLEAPILWYLARIVTPEFSVKGATVPGLPVVLLGQNNNIAWGMTTTGSDVQDLFVETVDPNNHNNYMTPSGSTPFETRKEQISIKGAESVTMTIRRTRHGPVMSDIDPEMAKIAGSGKVISLAFTGLNENDRTAESLLRVNQAVNWKEFQEAFRLYESPPQNVVFADIKGDIGFINPGLVPIRKSGDGMMPVEGSSGTHDWKGTIPFEQWPRVYNPDAGFVFNANNALVSNNGGNYYGTDWEEPYRAMRIQQFFDITDQHTLDSSAHMQADHVSLVARQLLPVLLRMKFDTYGENANPRATEAIDMLRDWDGTMDKNRPEPLIFEAWLYQMHKLLLVNQAHQPIVERGPFAANSMALILDKKDNGWCRPDICDAYSRQAFVESLAWLTSLQGKNMKNWRWGAEHIALLQNKVFKHFPFLAKSTDLSVASNGDFYTLDRGGSFAPPDDQPFAREHGGGYRAIYDLANPDRSRFMITTGQSGHVFSPHYGDLVPLWNDVKSISLSGTEPELAAQNLPLLEFTP